MVDEAVARFEETDSNFFLIFFSCLFTFDRETETEHDQGRGRERGRQRVGKRLQAPSSSTEPNAGLELRNSEIVT